MADTTQPVSITEWTDRLALDVAMVEEGSGDTVEDILFRHNMAPERLDAFKNDLVFQRKVLSYREDLKKNGVTFRLKARAQAEELLFTSWDLIHDLETSPAVKADLIKSTVKWAGLEPKDQPTLGGGDSGVRITINLGPQEPKTAQKTLTIDQVTEQT